MASQERGDAMLRVQRLVQLGIYRRRREIAVRAAVEGDVESVDRALGLPEAIRDDATALSGEDLAMRGCWGSSSSSPFAGSLTIARTPAFRHYWLRC